MRNLLSRFPLRVFPRLAHSGSVRYQQVALTDHGDMIAPTRVMVPFNEVAAAAAALPESTNGKSEMRCFFLCVFSSSVG